MKMKRPLLSFIVLSFIIFVLFLGVIGLSMGLGASDAVVDILKLISAWSSTFAFIILFKRIYPNIKLKDFIKGLFKTKINLLIILFIIFIPIVIFVLTLILLPDINSINNAFNISGIGMFVYWFFYNLFNGPLGEEVGWRGYALNELQKKHSPLKASLIMGSLWGFFHFPLWILSGYTGLDLLKYSLLFLITIISFSVVLTFFYNKNRNLLIPIIIHLMFNFLTSIINADILDIFLYTAIGYVITAVLIIIFNYQFMIKKTDLQRE